MADAKSRVTAMVERALKKSPELKSTELKERAAKIDKSIAKLTGRQFHAQYVIQVRKKLFGGSSRRTPSRRKATTKSRSSQATHSFLRATYQQKKAELDAAIEAAYDRAIAADSVKQVDKLLASLEQGTRDFQRV